MNGVPGSTPAGPVVLPRLTPAALADLPRSSGWTAPAAAAATRPARVGIVHLGIGAFHRAHQATFTEDAALATGDDRWGILGVSQRSASVVSQLAPQDGLYGVLERGVDARPLRIIGAVRQVHFVGDDAGLVLERIADPDVHLVTLTVSEKGYRLDPSGDLDLDDPGIRADLAGGARAPRTVVGQLVGGLRRRMAGTGAPLTVVSCDNLTGNGHVLRRLVGQFVAALPDGDAGTFPATGRLPGAGPLADWLASSVRFPASMVDRIVPATSAADRERAAAALGLRDEGLVVAEPFRQWVIEDDFAGPRPAWERAGVQLVADVAPWEAAKLRLLNGAHSTLAYLGALRGHPTVARALADDDLRAVVENLMVADATPTLILPPGLDVVAYRAEVLRRFADPALQHRTTQIAMDGSQKLPGRLVGTLRDRLAAGALPRWAGLGVAAWMAYVARSAAGQPSIGPDGTALPLPLDDPLADRLRAAVAASRSTAQLVAALLSFREVFDPELAAHPDLRALLIEDVDRLVSTGTRAVAAAGAEPRAVPSPGSSR